MSTRSVIAKEIGEDVYKAICCHNDGYPEHHGNILLECYNTPEKVDALLALGNISTLGRRFYIEENCAPAIKRFYKNDTTKAYNRDFGETGNEAQTVSLQEMTDGNAFWAVDYVYIFTQENEWKYIQPFVDREKMQDLKSHPDVYYGKPLIVGDGTDREKILAIMQDFCKDIELQYGGTWDLISVSLLADNTQCSEDTVKSFMAELGAKVNGNRIELNETAIAARRAIAARPNFSDFVWDIRQKHFAAKQARENESDHTEEESEPKEESEIETQSQTQSQ